MSNLTPAQAFGHIKALWPETARIKNKYDGRWEAESSNSAYVAASSVGVKIDWGAQTEYPPPVTYREPTLEDVKNGAEAGDPDCDLMSKDGSITLRCYYSGIARQWRRFCGGKLLSPIYIRARACD